MPRPNVTAKVETITPTKARKLLETSPGNRKESPTEITRLIRDIQSGAFQVNGETITIDTDGSLMNGHTRLKACIEAGVPIDVVVVRGVLRKAMGTIDTGKSRSLACHLSLFGYKNVNNLSAALRAVYSYMITGSLGSKDRATLPTASEAMYFLENDVPDLPDLIESSTNFTPIAATHANVMRFLAKDDPTSMMEFIQEVHLGESLAKDNPSLILRNILLNDASSTRFSNRKLTIYTRFALTIKAWNAWREGESRRSLRWRTTGKGREDFPTLNVKVLERFRTMPQSYFHEFPHEYHYAA